MTASVVLYYNPVIFNEFSLLGLQKKSIQSLCSQKWQMMLIILDNEAFNAFINQKWLIHAHFYDLKK